MEGLVDSFAANAPAPNLFVGVHNEGNWQLFLEKSIESLKDGKAVMYENASM